ncbi:HAD-IA family hydrolase [Nocardioides sp. NPDC127514]|uniref:HAD family hydrolase n=1 Tax=unclassified Nocardioides TaxID=2615069 RepID=UPI003321DED4
MSPSPVRHVLFDADGVLQHLPGGWHAAVAQFVGDSAEEFLLAAWAKEAPMQAGADGDFLAILADLLSGYGATAPAEEVYAAVWNRVEVHPESAEVVHRVRAAGYGVHLGTNQAEHRATFMRTALGYDDLFDVSCYSFDLGIAKPEPKFFHRAAARIGAAPHEIVFIDDKASNVEAARSIGMPTVHWTFSPVADAASPVGATPDRSSSHSALIEQLSACGIRL